MQPTQRSTLWLPAWSLAQREVVRFLRQRSRLIGALGQPILFWILFGAGLQGSFRADNGASFQEYFFPGVAVMILLFTAIFSTISIIEDRREGFLQGVLASPASRLAIVLGKLLGGTILAVSQALLFLLVGPLLGNIGLIAPVQLGITLGNCVPAIGFLVILGLALTALGYAIAWQLDSTQGFHAIMSIFLMPMWLLSGAFFPPGESVWLRWIMFCNPLTYGVAGLRRLLVTDPVSLASLPTNVVCWSVTLGFGLACTAFAVWLTSRPSIINSR